MTTNPFEALCRLAAKENWCWNIVCTTCGHMHFRFAFRELTMGGHPEDAAWSTRRDKTHKSLEDKLGPTPPRDWSTTEQENLATILSKTSIEQIAAHAPFPDWLGYLGLALHYTHQNEIRDRTLTRSWVPQFLKMLSPSAQSRNWLGNLEHQNGILIWQDLEKLESDLRSPQCEL